MPDIQYFKRTTAVISVSTGESNEIICLGNPSMLYIPAGFLTSTLTFLTRSDENGAYGNPLKDSVGDVVSIAGVAAGDPVSLDPSVFNGIQLMKIKCSVAQAANIVVVFTPVFGNYLA
jgi:hypothetical protein